MSPTWKTAPAIILALATSSPVVADFVGLNIGANHWAPDLTGSFSSSGSTSVNLRNDLGFKDHSSSSLSISLEHPIPILPNIKYTGSDLNVKSNSTLTKNVTFDTGSFTTSDAIRSNLDLSHNDIILYYELLDNWVNIDLGLDLKVFDGRVSIDDINNSANSGSIIVDETIPMLYIAARFDLPFTGLYVGANINQLSVGDNSAEDTTLMIGYESKSGLGIEGGIKTFSIELDDSNDLNTNLEYDGLYINGYYHF